MLYSLPDLLMSWAAVADQVLDWYSAWGGATRMIEHDDYLHRGSIFLLSLIECISLLATWSTLGSICVISASREDTALLGWGSNSQKGVKAMTEP